MGVRCSIWRLMCWKYLYSGNVKLQTSKFSTGMLTNCVHIFTASQNITSLSCTIQSDCERSAAQMKCTGAGWSVGCTGGRECTCLMGKLMKAFLTSGLFVH